MKKHKEDKRERLRKIALKYQMDNKNQNSDDETSSNIYMATEEEDPLLDDESTILNKDRHYFGDDAKHKFWDLYKSNRAFKDHPKDDVQDPRFAYMKVCHELKMLPKARMIIRKEKTSSLSFRYFGLFNKNAAAVAESLKRYPLEIEELDFTGNGIKSKE
jgi:hypothetical protein